LIVSNCEKGAGAAVSGRLLDSLDASPPSIHLVGVSDRGALVAEIVRHGRDPSNLKQIMLPQGVAS